MPSFLTAAAFVASLASSTGAVAANFSDIPPFPQQQAQVPADPPAQPQHQQPSPYDSPDFIVPSYEIQS
jgi:hypothetical protein